MSALVQTLAAASDVAAAVADIPDVVIDREKAREQEMIRHLPSLAPVLCLVAATVGGIALSISVRRQVIVAWAVGLLHVGCAVAALAVWQLRGFDTVMSGTVAVDGLSLALAGIVGVGGTLSVMLMRGTLARTDREGELYAMLAAASLGSLLLGSARDVALLALALGLTGIASYVMAGYLRRSPASNEASLKFYIYGTVAGAVMIYGLTLWYGLAGSTDIAVIGTALPSAPTAAVVGATALIVVGLAFEASLVPFHFWTPDVYEGAPISVAAFVSVIPKAAALVALARILPLALPDGLVGWPTAIAAISAVTMVLGTLAAMTQRNVVRLLAWSSIAQAGFMLMGVAALESSAEGLPALVYYLIAYAATNLAAFTVAACVARDRGSVDIDAFAGLARRHPLQGAALLVALLSLLGVPPLSGFVGKLEVFTAAIDAGQAWLAVVGIVATVAWLYPYLRVLAPAFLDAPGDEPRQGALASRPALVVTLGLAGLATVGVGIGAQPFLELAEHAVALGA
ncbi:MAG: NADH-quinone oxidoreductase subunit N [Solirubrobacterales bacterium]